MKLKIGCGAALLMLLSGMSQAESGGVSFSHKDWEVVCDNTLTCRIAGYNAQDEGVGSVLITRAAGPSAPLSGEVTLADTEADENTEPVTALTLVIDGESYGTLKTKNDNWQLSAAQAGAIVDAVRGSGKVEFKGSPVPFELSSDGAYAVMLKADDVQGRIGTPGALTKKGNKAETSVTSAVAAPVIQAAVTLKSSERTLTAPEVAVLKPRLMATLSENESCDRFQQPEADADQQDSGITLTPLDKSHALISTLCWRAAYNEGYGYWVIDSQLKGNPVLVTDSATDYDSGVISLSQKGRGIGDCWGQVEWVWDGKAFQKSRESTSGMCRLIHLGGTWDLPTWVADVKPAK